jgi:hypothetical protein
MLLVPSPLFADSCGVKFERVADSLVRTHANAIIMAPKSLLVKDFERVPAIGHHGTARLRLYNNGAGEGDIRFAEHLQIMIQ